MAPLNQHAQQFLQVRCICIDMIDIPVNHNNLLVEVTLIPSKIGIVNVIERQKAIYFHF